jgi:hypothetical protein
LEASEITVSKERQIYCPAVSIPQVVLLDATDGPHFSNLCSSSYDFDANVGLGLNRGILVVCELRWRRIGVIFHITRNQL